MRKVYLLITLLSNIIFAQLASPSGNIQATTNPSSGNVGIGTNNPSSKLEIYGGGDLTLKGATADAGDIIFQDNTGKQLARIWSLVDGGLHFSGDDNVPKMTILNNGVVRVKELRFDSNNRVKLSIDNDTWQSKELLSNSYDDNNGDYTDIKVAGYGVNNSLIRLNAYGNLGIGTENPKYKLDVNGVIRVKELKLDSNNRVKLSIDNDTWQSKELLSTSYDDNNGDYIDIKVVGNNVNNSLVRLNAYGNLGIGTENPKYKLDVNGTIHSKEIKVDMDGWADYVFKENYNLPTLQEVEKHIQEKGHLQNIPSEKEVIENGLSLAENQKLLLQKIEELTLYIIELNKQIQNLKKN